MKRPFGQMAAVALLAACAAAPEPPHGISPLLERAARLISDADVTALRDAALSYIQFGRCEQNTPCAPTTQAERENPPISIADGRAALSHGVVSALAQWCGLDWKRSFLPMLAYGRTQMRMNDRQINLMSLMHGQFQTMQLATYRQQGTCPPATRAELDAALPKL